VFYQHNGANENSSVVLGRSRKHHAMRRRAWDRAFNGTMLAAYEPKGKALTDKFLCQLRAHAGEEINITEWARYFATDFMGLVGLGKSYGMIDKLEVHDSVKNLIPAMWMLGVVGQVPWLVALLMRTPGAARTFNGFTAWCKTQMDEKIRVRPTTPVG
jgi:hypothetical protein